MRTLKLLSFLLLIVFFSCSKETSNSKPKPQKSPLELQRQVFADLVVSKMQNEIKETINLYSDVNDYLARIDRLEHEDLKTLKAHHQNFLANNQSDIESFRLYRTEFLAKADELKQSISDKQKERSRLQSRYELKNTRLTSCSSKVKQRADKLKAEAKRLKEDLNRRSAELTSHANRFADKYHELASYTESDPIASFDGAPSVSISFPYKSYVAERAHHLNAIIKAAKEKRYNTKIKKEYLPKNNEKKLKTFMSYAKIVQVKAVELIRSSHQIEARINKETLEITKKDKQCSSLQGEVSILEEDLLSRDKKISTKYASYQKLVSDFGIYIEDNDEFIQSLKNFNARSDVLTGQAQDLVYKKTNSFKTREKNLVSKYSTQYLEIFNKLKAFMTSKEIIGSKVTGLITFINKTQHKSKELDQLKQGLLKILEFASEKKLASVEFGKRSIAFFKVGSLDLRAESVLKAGFKGIGDVLNVTKGVLDNLNLSGLSSLEFKLAHIELSSPKLDVASFNFDIKRLKSLDLSNINLKQALSLNLDSPKIKIDIPEIPVLSELATQFREGITTLLNDVKELDLSMDLSKVELIRIEANVENDLKNPGKILTNGMLVTGKALGDGLTTIGKGVGDILRESTQFAKDTKEEMKRGFRKTGKALEAAGQPKNLARMALVYAATTYAGPLGSSIANAMMDKLENPGISDEALFKSFAVGAASGYAAEFASGVDVQVVQDLPNVTHNVVKNITSDLGHASINGEAYTSADFFAGIARGSVTVDLGDNFTSNIVESALNSAKGNATDSLIKEGSFDEDAFTDALYSGLANGVTREAVHGLMDEYVTKHLPQRVDKKMITLLGDMIWEAKIAKEEAIQNRLNLNFKHMSKADQEDYMSALFDFLLKHQEQYAQMKGIDVKDLTKEDLLSKEYIEHKEDSLRSLLKYKNSTLYQLSEKLIEGADGAKSEDNAQVASTGKLAAGFVMFGALTLKLMTTTPRYLIQVGKTSPQAILAVACLIDPDNCRPELLATSEEIEDNKEVGERRSAPFTPMGDPDKDPEDEDESDNDGDSSKSGSKSAENAASHEKFKQKLRQSSEKPNVENPELKDIVNQNYRPKAEVGSGSTADALRSEKLTGKPTKGKMHETKARHQVDRIRKWLRKNPNASQSDRSAAKNILKDLLDALGEL